MRVGGGAGPGGRRGGHVDSLWRYQPITAMDAYNDDDDDDDDDDDACWPLDYRMTHIQACLSRQISNYVRHAPWA